MSKARISDHRCSVLVHMGDGVTSNSCLGHPVDDAQGLMHVSYWLTDFPPIEHRKVMIIDLSLGSCVPNLGMFSNSELAPLPLACEFWKEGHDSQATYILFGPYTPENCDLGTNWGKTYWNYPATSRHSWPLTLNCTRRNIANFLHTPDVLSNYPVPFLPMLKFISLSSVTPRLCLKGLSLSGAVVGIASSFSLWLTNDGLIWLDNKLAVRA